MIPPIPPPKRKLPSLPPPPRPKKVEKHVQDLLLDVPEDWEEHWQGMPEFVQENQKSFMKVIVHFDKFEDALAFGRLIGQKINPETKSLWYPKAEIKHVADKRYADES